jgi:uridine kinase
MDSFYKVRRTKNLEFIYLNQIKVLSDEQHEQANENNYNFDHPDAFDFDLLLETLKNLKMGKQVR